MSDPKPVLPFFKSVRKLAQMKKRRRRVLTRVTSWSLGTIVEKTKTLQDCWVEDYSDKKKAS